MSVKKENNRNLIVQNAKDVFSKYGFHKTTMEEIAKSIHKRKSSLYYYFKSKEDVFYAVVDNEVLELRNEIFVAVEKAETPTAKLKAYILTRLKTLNKMDNLNNALRNEYLSQLEYVVSTKEKYRREEYAMVKSIIDKGFEENKYEFKNTGSAAKAIVLAISGLEFDYFLSPFKKDLDGLEATMNEFVDMFAKLLRV